MYHVEYMNIGSMGASVWFLAYSTGSITKAENRARRLRNTGRVVRITEVR